MAYYTVTLRCNKCQSQFRIHNVGPVLTNGIYKYCINCGNDGVYVSQDSDKDYWETLAENYDMSTESIKEFYDLWVQDKSGTPFNTFVNATKKLLKQMSLGSVGSGG